MRKNQTFFEIILDLFYPTLHKRVLYNNTICNWGHKNTNWVETIYGSDPIIMGPNPIEREF